MFLEKDYLNRKEDVENITKIINNMRTLKEFNSFAINGSWGTGKTFLINMLKESLGSEYLFIIYDAWQNNYFDEPLIGLLDCLMKNLNKDFINNNLLNKCRDIISSCLYILDTIIYSFCKIKPFETLKGVLKYEENKKKTPSFNTHAKIQEAKSKTIELLRKLSEDIPIIIVVDELDRCSPEYALKVLERVHHIKQDDSQIISVYCVDKRQLEKIVKSLYPNEYNSNDTSKLENDNIVDGYLRKIIDFKYELNYGEMEDVLKIIPDEILELFLPEYSHVCLKDQQFIELISDIISDVGVRAFKKILETCFLIHRLSFSENKYPKDLLAFEIFSVYCGMKNNENHRNMLINEYLKGRYVGNNYDHVIVDDLKSLIGYIYERNIKKRILLFTNGYSRLINTPSYIPLFLNSFVPFIGKIKV